MERMRRYGRIAVPILIAGIALLAGVGLIWRTAEAARIPAGAQRALAGSGGVTAKTFVKLSAADTIVASTAVTDSVVGVCELTASANANTMYAPVGSITTVTSGELIAVGNLLTSGTGGKAFVLDTDDTSTQRVCAVAMTAASGADEDTTVLIVAGTAEQRIYHQSYDPNTSVTLGVPVELVFMPDTAHKTIGYLVPAAYDLLVLDAIGWKTAGAGDNAADQWELKNGTGGTNIFDTEELNTVADKAMVQFDNLDDAQYEVEGGTYLELVGGEDSDDDGVDGIVIVTVIFKAAD